MTEKKMEPLNPTFGSSAAGGNAAQNAVPSTDPTLEFYGDHDQSYEFKGGDTVHHCAGSPNREGGPV